MENKSNALLKKLQFKAGMNGVFFHLPENLLKDFQEFGIAAGTETTLHGKEPEFFLAFVRDSNEVEAAAEKYLPSMRKDAFLWFCFPKKTSALYTAGLSRDEGWDYLMKQDYLPVRNIAMDENWSALRFRHRSHISKITRKF